MITETADSSGVKNNTSERAIYKHRKKNIPSERLALQVLYEKNCPRVNLRITVREKEEMLEEK